MDGSEINNILFQALKGVTQLGEQGEATKRALLLTMEAAVKMEQPDERAAKEQLKLEARAAREEAARLFRAGQFCMHMMARQIVIMKALVVQDYATKKMEETATEIAEWASQLRTAGNALARLNLPECRKCDGTWKRRSAASR